MKNTKKIFRIMGMFFLIMGVCSSACFAATVGADLGTPEAGWQRIDDSDKKFHYNGAWLSSVTGTHAWYKGGIMSIAPVNSTNSDTVNFNFYGSKLRIIAQPHKTRTNKVQVKIDGVIVGNYTMTSNKVQDQTLLFEKTGLDNKVHSVELLNLNPKGAFLFDAIDLETTGYLVDIIQPTLSATAGNSQVALAWNVIDGATEYIIQRSTSLGEGYETIATSVDSNYIDATVKNGTTYYYVVRAMGIGEESIDSNEVSATPINSNITLEVMSLDKAKVGDEIVADIVIHNASNICAEDISLAYDSTKLTYLGSENADGIKIYKESNDDAGNLRYITASLGKDNAANGDKILLKLKFRATAAGEAKIDIINGRIADNATLEENVEDVNCGEKTVLIEGNKDVNRSGEFTLLDLGIDAWYYGNAVTATDTTKYDADIVENGVIDDEDLSEIVNLILKNSNYPSPSK